MQDVESVTSDSDTNKGDGSATGNSTVIRYLLPGIDQLSEVSELRQHQHPLTLGLGNMATVLPEEVITRIPAIVEWVLQDL